MTTLNTDTVLANVETYLAQQYERRQQAQRVEHPADGVIVFVVMLGIAMIVAGMGK